MSTSYSCQLAAIQNGIHPSRADYNSNPNLRQCLSTHIPAGRDEFTQLNLQKSYSASLFTGETGKSTFVFGDSIAQGTDNIPGQELTEQAAMPGFATGEYLNYLEDFISQLKSNRNMDHIGSIVISIGTNDVKKSLEDSDNVNAILSQIPEGFDYINGDLNELMEIPQIAELVNTSVDNKVQMSRMLQDSGLFSEETQFYFPSILPAAEHPLNVIDDNHIDLFNAIRQLHNNHLENTLNGHENLQYVDVASNFTNPETGRLSESADGVHLTQEAAAQYEGLLSEAINQDPIQTHLRNITGELYETYSPVLSPFAS